jgi:hypothetical protein
MKIKLMIRSVVGVALAVGLVGLSGSAWAGGLSILDISDPIQYGSDNTYFAYARLSGGATWDEAEALAAALPTYNGLSAHLAVFSTEESYTWMVANVNNFTSPSIGDWDQAWIGAKNNGGTYEWIAGGGPVTTTHWDTTWNPPQPKAANYGVVWMFKEYGNVLTTEPKTSPSFANAVVQYGVIPEPATALLFGIGGMGAWMLRRNKVKSKEETDA